MTELILGDCLEKMSDIADGSVDMILTDPPYGTTACAWDSIIPLEPMWAHLKRIIKPNGAIVMASSQPFTTKLISSNMKMFKYEWIWEKSMPGMFFSANYRPLKIHENVIVFSAAATTYSNKGTMKYNPQCIKREKPYTDVRKKKGRKPAAFVRNVMDRSDIINRDYSYPLDIIKFSNGNNNSFHPTQKPVKLMEYLILTYTNKGETVLDFTMGSGTTGVACVETGRGFIGIELDPGYFKIAQDRIKKAQSEPRLDFGGA